MHRPRRLRIGGSLLGRHLCLLVGIDLISVRDRDRPNCDGLRDWPAWQLIHLLRKRGESPSGGRLGRLGEWRRLKIQAVGCLLLCLERFGLRDG